MHKNRKIGLQLFSVRDDYQADLSGTLKKIARMGYDGVEFFGPYPAPALDLRLRLEDAGLRAAGYHVLLPALEGGELDRTIEYMDAIDAENVVLAVVPEARRKTKKDWQAVAELFVSIAPRFEKNGLTLGYHNHRMEFEPVEGALPFDILFAGFPVAVTMQLDCGHALRAGADPAELLRRYPGRSRTIHIRDYHRTNDKALVGEGDVDWMKILPLCGTIAKTEWYVIEQGDVEGSPLEAAGKNIRNLEALFDEADRLGTPYGTA